MTALSDYVANGSKRQTLARIPDGSSRAWSVHVLRVRVHCFAVPPVVASSSNDSRRRAATTDDGNGDGFDRNRNHLFTTRKTLGSALQSISNLDLLSTRKNQSVGCSLLHTVSIRRRHRRNSARFTHAR